MSLSFLFTFLHSQLFVTPPKPSQSWTGKTVIVTGGNGGIGLEAARLLTGLKASKVIIACRNVPKGREAKKSIETSTSCTAGTVEVWELDLGSYDSVKGFSARALKELPRIDALVENAGTSEGQQFKRLEDNEASITVNVISTFLLAILLLPRLRDTALQHPDSKPAITIVTSELSHIAKFHERATAPPGKIFDTLNDLSSANIADRYMVCKLLQVLGTRELAMALGPGLETPVIVDAANPGLNDTEMVRAQWRSKLGLSETFIDLLLPRIARQPMVGASAILAGVEAGPQAHGMYMSDGVVAIAPRLALGTEGQNLQAAVWEELMDKLEGIAPGVTAAIR